jgi:hypothetical protein
MRLILRLRRVGRPQTPIQQARQQSAKIEVKLRAKASTPGTTLQGVTLAHPKRRRRLQTPLAGWRNLRLNRRPRWLMLRWAHWWIRKPLRKWPCLRQKA